MTQSGKLRHIMVLTGEPSGDLHAGHLVNEIKQLDSQIYFSGIGGHYLEQQGVDLFYDIHHLSAMGLTEVILQFRQIKKAFDLFKERLKTHTPDLIILVDYPGFNLKAAQYAKTHFRVKILYYITPKVWAWKKSRLKKIKKYVNHAALILPFEEKIYKKARIQATYVGNPLIDEYPENILKSFYRSIQTSNKQEDSLIIGLLPGSRKAEIKNLFEIMLETAGRIHQKFPRVSFIISQASSIRKKSLEKRIQQHNSNLSFKIDARPVKDIFIESDMVIAASGTVTLEAALCCVPTIIIYKMSLISYWIAKLVVQIKYAGLANLIVNKEVMPEFLQNEADPEKICRKALHMIGHLNDYEQQLQVVRKLLGKKGAAKRTANIVTHMLSEIEAQY
jgi:lipid-A-disaccharide synthase